MGHPPMRAGFSRAHFGATLRKRLALEKGVCDSASSRAPGSNQEHRIFPAQDGTTSCPCPRRPTHT